MRNGKTSGRPRVYLAAPLFSDAERAFNISIRDALSACVDLYLPQEQVGLVADMVGPGEGYRTAVARVFQADIRAVNDADALLIVLDGRAIDEGAAFELGYAFAMGKTCIGLQTDLRRAHPWGNNPMIQESVQPVFRSLQDLREWAQACIESGGRADANSTWQSRFCFNAATSVGAPMYPLTAPSSTVERGHTP